MAEDGYGKSAVGQIRTYIKACFEYTTDEELIEKNPARKLVMPNIQKKSCERFLSVEELRSLLSQACPREHLVLRILAVCGLLPAEVLVRRIEDFEGTQLRIDEALKERQRGEHRIGETKTDESDNYVPVPRAAEHEGSVLLAQTFDCVLPPVIHPATAMSINRTDTGSSASFLRTTIQLDGHRHRPVH